MMPCPSVDICSSCRREVPWEWIPPVVCAGKRLAGTALWRQGTVDNLCTGCHTARDMYREAQRRERDLQRRCIALVGGEKPYRELTFERYCVAPGNRLALGRAIVFNPGRDNLYLWGPCGVGKTHLAYAIAMRELTRSRDAAITTVPQFIRKVRMRPPEEEQNVLERFTRVHVLIIDDLGVGTDTAYGRQVLQELLDGRHFRARAGLVVTSKYSLGALAEKLNDDTLASRLAGMCHVIEVRGPDHRLINRPTASPPHLLSPGI